ncbi:hypothetical protein NH399_16590 [Pleionea sp. CnH1-48]|nr:hypothetical protein [Pleionea sp. CnH1-48]
MIKHFYSSKEWERRVVPKETQLPLKASDVQGFLLSALPHKFGPYSVISSYFTSIRSGPDYYNTLCEISLYELNQERDGGVFQFFIRSKKLTPSLKLNELNDSNEALVINGLISLQIFKNYRGATIPPTLNIVDRVVHKKSKEEISHIEYYEIFRALRRAKDAYVRKHRDKKVKSSE